MRVAMIPDITMMGKHESGIKRVVEAYTTHLPKFDIEIVNFKDPPYVLRVAHAGVTGHEVDVTHCHGLYFTGEYAAAAWEWKANRAVIAAIKYARQVTVPTQWVAEVIQRDLRFTPHVVPHGIDWDAWQHNLPTRRYVLWNKNRNADVCDPRAVRELAMMHQNIHFYTTFSPAPKPPNVVEIGLQIHEKMKKYIQEAAVYLSSTKETFGIGVLEAMAAGVPVLGFAHGGNLDLIEHGVTGYLARPNDWQDLGSGLAYCLQHRKVLGANARAAARGFTWEAACEQIAGIYRMALQADEEPTVSIIIPSYNYGDQVGRAIKSAVQQTYSGLRNIIVVDDGSTDDGRTQEVVQEWAAQDDRVQYVRQDNAGVAIARNRGIELARTKYVACLDADDALAPTFIEVCVAGLEAEPDVGITYTGLTALTPDGKSQLSQWPGDFDYDKQLKKQNQIPTACVFRRAMWERLGGYRQRYAPGGAGAEDAEFWLRAGAYGYKGKKVTNEGLFLYSWQSGRVSGDPNYREVDWREWHPWVKDEQHPFGSVATAEKFSHPVRFYDEPVVSVVIPVGPRHLEKVIDALDSVEAQTYRHWEIVVVFDDPQLQQKQPDQSLVVDTETNIGRMMTAYPYVTFAFLDGRGAGAARNYGASLARGDFLLFLDADDHLRPNAIEYFLAGWGQENAIFYSDYVAITVLDDPTELKAQVERDPFRRWLNYFHGRAVIEHRPAEFDCERALRQPEVDRPYIWNLVTSLVPIAWHQEIGGFDETMKSWEDWDYWIRLARAGKCFIRIDEPLVVYHFQTGSRREIGLQSFQELFTYLTEKYQAEEQPMGCNCRGKKQSMAVQQALRAMSPPAVQSIVPEETEMQDDKMHMAKYLDPNRGQHGVKGPETGIFYGYRKGGDEFLVHEDDLKHTNKFERITESGPAPPATPQPPPPAPVLVTEVPAPKQVEESPVNIPPEMQGETTDFSIKRTFEPEEAAPAIGFDPLDEAVLEDLAPPPLTTPVVDPTAPLGPDEEIDLQTIPGMTPALEKRMIADGMNTANAILGAANLQHIKGIGPAKAELIVAFVKGLIKDV